MAISLPIKTQIKRAAKGSREGILGDFDKIVFREEQVFCAFGCSQAHNENCDEQDCFLQGFEQFAVEKMQIEDPCNYQAQSDEHAAHQRQRG